MTPVYMHRATYRRAGHQEWWVACACGWEHWARARFHAEGFHRDHVHRVIRLSKRKAS